MKKIIALCLAVCLAASFFTSCGDDAVTTTTATDERTDPVSKSYNVDEGLLISCIGQADENGVYRVPDEVTAIAESAFAGDTNLREVVIGSNVTMIGAGAFQDCTALIRVEIESGVEQLGSYAFYNCSSLKDVVLPESVTVLNDYAFYGCAALESVSLPYVEKIGKYAFGACISLERVNVSENLKMIDEWAFSQCTTLCDLNLAQATSLESIGSYAFFSCSMLREIIIPNGVKSIGLLAFYECSRLDRVEIADSVTTIDFAAFNYTPWYQEYDGEYLIVGDGVLIKCTVHPQFMDLSGKNIKALGGAVFWNAENEGQASTYGYKYAKDLETIVLPDTLTQIGMSAFAGCYRLKTVVLPAGVTTVADNAFNVYSPDFVSETNVDISACTSLTTIGDYAFHGCMGIEAFVLPTTVTSVGEYAFAATQAYDSFMEKASASSDSKDHFWITGDGILLAVYVPDGLTSVSIPHGVKMIGGAAFCGWDVAYIPEDLSTLSHSGRSKYNISYRVTEIVLPETLEVIGNSAFYRALSLKSVLLPSSLRVIGMHAFAYCDALEVITGGENIEEIQNYAFRYCTKIPGFRFSSNTKRIGVNLFSGCTSLKTVYLPEGLSHPGENLFNSECVSLQMISMDTSARPRVYTILGNVQQQIEILYYED